MKWDVLHAHIDMMAGSSPHTFGQSEVLKPVDFPELKRISLLYVSQPQVNFSRFFPPKVKRKEILFIYFL